jgi:hypothetical protein
MLNEQSLAPRPRQKKSDPSPGTRINHAPIKKRQEQEAGIGVRPKNYRGNSGQKSIPQARLSHHLDIRRGKTEGFLNQFASQTNPNTLSAIVDQQNPLPPSTQENIDAN